MVVEELPCRAEQGSTVKSDWESPQSSGDYRIPSAQTSHPPGNRENGGNQRVRGRSPSQCSLGHLDYLLPTQCSTITDIIRSTRNKGGKIVHCSQSSLHVPFMHYWYSPMRGSQLQRWELLWAEIHFLIKETKATSTLQSNQPGTFGPSTSQDFILSSSTPKPVFIKRSLRAEYIL